MDTTKSNTWATLNGVEVMVSIHSHAQLPSVARAEIASVVITDEMRFVVIEKFIEGKSDSIGTFSYVDQSIMPLDLFAKNDGFIRVGMVAIRKCEMVDPDIRACDDTNAVVLRVPIPS